MISVFGLGYVGTVTGACLAETGVRVIAVDVDPATVDLINQGQSPVVEAELDGLIKRTVERGTFTATTDAVRAVRESEAALVCVGTPGRSNGSIDLTFVQRVAETIGTALRTKSEYFVFVLRSTVLPGTVEGDIIPVLERRSGKKAGTDFGVCVNPEFLRRGNAVADFFRSPRNVIGELDQRSGNVVATLYQAIPSPKFHVPIRVAEMLKYADNAFRALKVTFANEIGSICKPLGIDSQQVMEVITRDTKLNLSPHYLEPGFAFGGSDLPRDVRALTYKCGTLNIETPMLSSILPSNRLQISRVAVMLMEHTGKRLGFLGLSSTGGIDELTESPLVELIETMLGRGFAIRVYDPFVSLARLVDADRKSVDQEFPHISALLADSAEDVMACSDVLVVGARHPEFAGLVSRARPGQTVIDLVRITKRPSSYYGLPSSLWD
jgi:GDP-mannose 6-dehydrogenase